MARKRKAEAASAADEAADILQPASPRAASPRPASTPAANAAVEYEKPHLNVYTMMLLISFIALVTGSVLLYLELQPYGNFLEWWQTTGV